MIDYVLGIDVSKATLDVVLLSAHAPAADTRERGRHRQVPNTADGLATLRDWLAAQGVTTLHACLEATNTYGWAVADALQALGATVSVVNPYAIKHFALSELRRSKTDRIDAAVIARFCRSHRPRPWTPPTPAQRELVALTRRLDDVQAAQTQERNRRQTPGLPAAALASIDRVLAVLATERAMLQEALEALVAADPAIAHAVSLVATIPGIGRATAIRLVAEIGEVTRFASARQLAAYAGLVPRHRQSGTSLHGRSRLCRVGASLLRRLLFFPAMTAMRHNPRLQPFVARLRAAGKAPMAIVGAVMHKLIRLVYGVLVSNTPFQAHELPTAA